MNQQDFNKLVEDRCDKIKKTLASKGKEYSTDDDKLHNFNKAGVRTGQSRERALMGMKLKHEISIDDIIDKLDSGVNPSIEVIDEKIGDIINYFILLEACLVDRLNTQEKRLRPLTPDECYKSTLKDRMKEPPDWGNLVGTKKEEKQKDGLSEKYFKRGRTDLVYFVDGFDEVNTRFHRENQPEKLVLSNADFDKYYTSEKEQEKSFLLVEGQEWIREQSTRILKEQQDKTFTNLITSERRIVIDVDLITGILTLQDVADEENIRQLTYFELSNEKRWKEDS